MTKDFVSKNYSTFRRESKKNRFSLSGKFRFKGIQGFFGYIKHQIVSRMFWGRSNLYKNITQFLMLAITIFIAISGLSSRIYVSGTSNLASGNEIIGSNDLLPQGGSIETVLINNASSVGSVDHVVKNGETLASIADQYKVSVDTVRWFNPDLISPFSNEIQTGMDLKIPAYQGQTLNGVLYTVKSGETLDSIIKNTSQDNNESNIFNVVEFNNLPAPYTLTPGQKLFIPDGNLAVNDVQVEGIPRGVFTNPLANPDCAGYIWERGFTFYHDGVDLSRYPGCDVEAVASGTVVYAGWEDLSGNCVKIDHGGGIQTNYYHAEAVYVKPGQRVQQGDIIMKMGSTGNSTGTHLHITLLKNGVAVDPEPYIPY